MGKIKIGKFSSTELDFIDANCLTMTPEQIAIKLNRTVETIREKCDDAKALKISVEDKDEKKALLLQLKSKPYWRDLQASYTPQELDRYEYHWMHFVNQFKGDMTHSEELQIMKLIDLEILLKRNLVERKDVDIKIAKLEGVLEDELEKDPRNDQMIISLSQQIMGLRGSQTSRTKDYNDMAAKHMSMTRELKATRDQRLEKIETGKTTLFGWLKLHEDRKRLAHTSKEAELMKLAMEKSRDELAEYYKYADGELDRPLLTPETVVMDEQPIDIEEDNKEEGEE